MIRLQHAALAAATLCLSSLNLAQAQTAQGLSIQVGAGASHYDIDCTGTISCDKSGTGYKLALGYGFTPTLSTEAIVIGFGKATASDRVGGTLVRAEGKSTGVGIALAGTFPFTSSLYAVGRLGVLSMDTQITGSAAGFSASESQRKAAPYVGLGLGYALDKNVSIGLDLDFSQAKFEGETADLRNIGAFVRYAF